MTRGALTSILILAACEPSASFLSSRLSLTRKGCHLRRLTCPPLPSFSPYSHRVIPFQRGASTATRGPIPLVMCAAKDEGLNEGWLEGAKALWSEMMDPQFDDDQGLAAMSVKYR